MSIRTGYSTRELPAAAADLKEQCGGREPRAVIFFASPKYDPAALSRAMRAEFPNSCLAGCSSAGELAQCRMMTGSVVAMFLDGDVVEDAATAVVGNLSSDISLKSAFEGLEQHFHMPVASLDMEKYVGLVMVDGLSGAEERLLERVGDACDLFFVGGSAGDDCKFQATHVLADGQSYRDAAVLVLLRLKHGFQVVKTQSFLSAGKILTATKVDEDRRMVLEFDGKPALSAYAEALGVSVAEAPAHFFRHPLGLMIEGEPFVRSPQHAEGSSIVFYCQIKPGMELEVLQATDIVSDTRKAIEQQKSAGAIRGIIDFQCILRTLQLREEQRCGEYGEIFQGIPNIGLSTYGEAYLGHLNQTSTMLVFR